MEKTLDETVTALRAQIDAASTLAELIQAEEDIDSQMPWSSRVAATARNLLFDQVQARTRQVVGEDANSEGQA